MHFDTDFLLIRIKIINSIIPLICNISACTLTTKNANLMSSSLNHGMEMSANNRILSPPSTAMSSSLKEEHELRTAHEISGEHTLRTGHNDQTNKNLRGNQRTSGMPVSVVYQVIRDYITRSMRLTYMY